MDANILKGIKYNVGGGSIINLFASIKRFLNNDKGNNSLKLYKNSSKAFFLKNETLGRLNSDYLNELTKILIDWYRVRIPDSLFAKDGDNVYINKYNVSYNNYEKMDFKQLLKRNNDLYLLKCNYRDNSFFMNNELSLKIFTKTGIFNNKIDKICTIFADRENGIITRIEGDYLLPYDVIVNCSNYNLEKLLKLLDINHIDSFNYDSLINCVANRRNDVNTRNKIINTVCLELFNSSEYDYGYYRALLFLKEISTFLELDVDINHLNKLASISKLNNNSQNIKVKKFHH